MDDSFLELFCFKTFSTIEINKQDFLRQGSKSTPPFECPVAAEFFCVFLGQYFVLSCAFLDMSLTYRANGTHCLNNNAASIIRNKCQYGLRRLNSLFLITQTQWRNSRCRKWRVLNSQKTVLNKLLKAVLFRHLLLKVRSLLVIFWRSSILQLSSILLLEFYIKLGTGNM